MKKDWRKYYRYDYVYTDAHSWLRKTYGRADKCVSRRCLGVSKIYDYALKKGHKHSRDRKSYNTLCRSCHTRYDMTDEKRKRLLRIAHTEEAERKKGEQLRGRNRPSVTKLRVKTSMRARAERYTAFGKSLPIVQWEEITKIRYKTLYARVKYYGLSMEEAILTPIRKPPLSHLNEERYARKNET